MEWNSLPPAARAVVVAAVDAVDAVARRDAEALDAAALALAAADGSGGDLGTKVLGMVARLRLEELHPDGLDADDVRTVLEDCVRSAGEWVSWVDPHVVLVLLASALGVHDPDENGAEPGPKDLARHGPLLVEQLMVGATRPLRGYLVGAFAEIQRGELHD